jgi:hypothetical protein
LLQFWGDPVLKIAQPRLGRELIDEPQLAAQLLPFFGVSKRPESLGAGEIASAAEEAQQIHRNRMERDVTPGRGAVDVGCQQRFQVAEIEQREADLKRGEVIQAVGALEWTRSLIDVVRTIVGFGRGRDIWGHRKGQRQARPELDQGEAVQSDTVLGPLLDSRRLLRLRAHRLLLRERRKAALWARAWR